MQFDHDGPGFLLLFVFFHLGLQPLVVLQRLLAPFHRHVEAGEDAAVPATTHTHSDSEAMTPKKPKESLFITIVCKTEPTHWG